MCLASTPKAPKVQPPIEYAQQKSPDYAGARSTAARRTGDRVRSASQTILTSGSGVTETADTEKKTLLGQ